MCKKSNRSDRYQHGFTIIEILVVASIIGILLAIAIPNLIKARISANESAARKAMQTLRDAEGEFFEQDADNNGVKDYTNFIGNVDASLSQDGSLRCPDQDAVVPCTESDALVDNSFALSVTSAGDGNTAVTADCVNAKSGYCTGWTGDTSENLDNASWSDPPAAGSVLLTDFGWEASPLTPTKTGRTDYGVWGDGVIRCDASNLGPGMNGAFEATRDGTSGPDGISDACD